MSDKIYLIITGEYSDWEIVGFETEEDKAMEYCALKNKEKTTYSDYYYEEVEKNNFISKNTKLYYKHEIVFDFDKGMRNEPDRYEYSAEEFNCKKVECKLGFRWIAFEVLCKDRKKAEKISQDKYAEFIYYVNELKSYKKAFDCIK